MTPAEILTAVLRTTWLVRLRPEFGVRRHRLWAEAQPPSVRVEVVPPALAPPAEQVSPAHRRSFVAFCSRRLDGLPPSTSRVVPINRVRSNLLRIEKKENVGRRTGRLDTSSQSFARRSWRRRLFQLVCPYG